MTSTIDYEQPLNELIRMCLRLEHLFASAQYHVNVPSEWGSRAAMVAMVEVLGILDRPDIKPKLTKELGRLQANFLRLEQTPSIDKNKLAFVLKELQQVLSVLHAMSGKMAPSLFENHFIDHIRKNVTSKGDAFGFDVPAYHHWLQQKPEKRLNILNDWYHELVFPRDVVALLLRIVRESSAPQARAAVAGFFQEALDPSLPTQLIRVSVPHQEQVFPRVSVGRHGISIRFYAPSHQHEATQSEENTRFELTCCVI